VVVCHLHDSTLTTSSLSHPIGNSAIQFWKGIPSTHAHTHTTTHTCIRGLGVQSWMQSGLSVFKREHKKTPSLRERAKSTRSTSGFVTRWVAGINPLLISHCRACLHSRASAFMVTSWARPLRAHSASAGSTDWVESHS